MQVFEEYEQYVDGVGLTSEGLEQIYKDGIGNIDADFATLGLKLVCLRKPLLDHPNSLLAFFFELDWLAGGCGGAEKPKGASEWCCVSEIFSHRCPVDRAEGRHAHRFS